jgi:hypothetical protein
MKNDKTNLPQFFYEDAWYTFNLPFTEGIDNFDDGLLNIVIAKFDMFRKCNFDVWVEFTQDEWDCFKKTITIGVDKLGKSFFSEEELTEIFEVLDYT